MIKYESQKVALYYIKLSLLLLPLQVLMGLWLAVNYGFTLPQALVDVFSFATARALHTNLLVAWLLLGFMGGTYFILPEECETELFSVKLAWLQLVLFAGAAVTAVVGFLFGWTQGKPLLEIPVPLDLVIVVSALIFIANVVLTIVKAKQRSLIQYMLAAGVIFLALLYLVGIPFFKNLNTDYYYWWWVIHLWVEGAWELVTAALMAFMMIQLTGVERKVVEKWLYVELGLFLFTGLAGTGHHYYWIAAPKYWLWVGGIFSALEPLPIAFMLIDTWRSMRKSKRPQPRLTWVYVIAMAVLHFVGAGLFGFAHTLPQINYYTHGSQVTVSHGHLAFFGAYVLLNLSFFYFAIPRLKGFPDGRYDERGGHWGFWMLSSGVVGMSLAMAVAGVLQTYLERVQGQPYIVAQSPIRFWMAIVFLHGLLALAGALTVIKHLLTLKPAPVAEA